VGEGPSRIVIRFVVGAPGRRHGSLRPQGLAWRGRDASYNPARVVRGPLARRGCWADAPDPERELCRNRLAGGGVIEMGGMHGLLARAGRRGDPASVLFDGAARRHVAYLARSLAPKNERQLGPKPCLVC
jgi:hypothetical protein